MGLSIISIILYHAYLFAGKYYGIELTPLKIFFSKGYIGVDVFFFLSSYGLCHSLNGGGKIKFYKRRILRILPTYIAYLVLYFLTFTRIGVVDGIKSSIFQISGLSSVRLLNQGMEWYIPALMILYISFPYLFQVSKYIVDRFGQKIELIGIASLCVMTYVFNVVFVSEFAYRIPIMVLGVLTYLHLERKQSSQLMLLYATTATLGLFFSCELLCYSLIIPLVLYSLDKINVTYPCNSFLQFCGRHSLELYLAQGLMLKNLMKTGWIDSLYLALIIAVIGIVIIGYLFHLVSKITEISIRR